MQSLGRRMTQDINTTDLTRNPYAIASTMLLSFSKLMYSHYDISPEHLIKLGKMLELVEKGDIKRLVITMPPRHGKSMLTSELFPAWYLGRNPTHNVMFASYNHTFASEFGRKVRNLILDPRFQRVFEDVKVSSDSQANDKFVLNKGGAYYALGVQGTLTGRGANCIAADTLISTNKGDLLMKDLFSNFHNTPSIQILSFNHATEVFEYKDINGISYNGVSLVMTLKTCSGKSVTLTADHPVYIMGKGYINASDLEIDDLVITYNSNGHREYSQISSISGLNSQAPIYDIGVLDNNNFLANGILVHNCLIIDDPIKNREEADSSLIRTKLQDWYSSTAYTRLEPNARIVVIQTRWHFEDLAGYLLEQKDENWTHLNLPAITTRADGTEESLWPAKYSVSDLKHTQSIISSRDWAALYMQTPFTDEGRFFKIEKMSYYEREFSEAALKMMNIYIFVDPANSKKETADQTAVVIIGTNSDKNFYLIDAFIDRYDLKEREDIIFSLHEKYDPRCIYYEKYGMQIDIDYIRQAMEYRNYRFKVAEVGGNKLSKEDRIKRLQPLIEDSKLFFPRFIHKVTTTGVRKDLIAYLHEEMNAFPYGKHDDFLDALSRICDLTVLTPNAKRVNYHELYK